MKVMITIAFILSMGFIHAQKVFSTQYANQAEVKVFVVKFENQADLKVFKVKYKNQSVGNDGKWFFTEYANQAKTRLLTKNVWRREARQIR